MTETRFQRQWFSLAQGCTILSNCREMNECIKMRNFENVLSQISTSYGFMSSIKKKAKCYIKEGKMQELWFIGCILIIIELEVILNGIIDMAVNDLIFIQHAL